MISLRKSKDIIVFSLVFVAGLAFSLIAQNSKIDEHTKQKKFDFESKISGLTLIIGDALKSKENYSTILSESISQIFWHDQSNGNQDKADIEKAKKLVENLSIHESFFIYRENTNKTNELISLKQNIKFDLKNTLHESLQSNNKTSKQFSTIIESNNKSRKAICLSTKLSHQSNMRLVSCCSLEALFEKVIKRSSEDWQQTHIFNGNRVSGFSHLYSYPNNISEPIVYTKLKARSDNLIFLPYAIKFADLDLSISFDPGNNFYQLNNWTDFLPFIFGLTLTLVLLYYIRYQSIETQIINHKVDLKTKELSDAKVELESQVKRSTVLYKKLQESNHGLSSLTNSVDGILWEGDPDAMRYSYVSDQVERIIGYPPEKFINGDFVIGNLTEGDKHSEINKKALSNIDNDSLRIEFCSERANKEKIWLKGIITPVYKDGKLHKLRGVYIDVSQQKLQEIKNQEIESKLRQSQKLEAIGHLAAGIAHEINTPAQFVGDNLNFIGTSTNDLVSYISKSVEHRGDSEPLDELLDEIDFEFLREELPDAIEQSKEGLARINKIVGAMKNFSHPDTEEKQRIDINKALESTVIVSKNEWKYIAELSLELEQDLPNINCHPGELNQVFLNIIVNAAHAIEQKYQGKSIGSITIFTKKIGDQIQISIQDDGCGIPQDVITKVFDHFFTTKGVGKGTGQGLSISHSVVTEKHNGTINIESEEGIGTTFHISLPIDS